MKKDLAALIADLAHPSDRVRWEAAQALGETQDTQAVPALIEALQDRNVHVRRDAAVALGKLGDARAVPALCEALTRWDRDVRRAAAVALGEIGNRHAVPALVSVLLDKEDEEMRQNVARALGKIALNDPSPVLRTALPTLERIHDSFSFWAQVQINRTTFRMRNLPIIADAPRPDPNTLPIPSAPTAENHADSQAESNAKE